MSEAPRASTVKTKAQSYRDLVVWQKGMSLAKLVYAFTRSLPSEERFGLIAQMRRAAISVPSNIAEGQARRSTREFVQFISNAEGSASELDTQVELCVVLGYKTTQEARVVSEAIDEMRRMLNGLRRSLLAKT